MRITLFSLAALATITAVPAFAQDAMASDSMQSKPMKKMSAAEMRKMKACQAMSHDRMMKNAECAKMMKAHPDMMKDDAMMKEGR